MPENDTEEVLRPQDTPFPNVEPQTEVSKEKKERKKRTTKPKEEGLPKGKKKSLPMSVEVIQNNIIGIHEMLALFTTPQVKITEQNAHSEAEALLVIFEKYGMEWLENYLPWMNLVFTLMICEMPSMVAVIMWARQRKNMGAEPMYYEKGESDNV